MDYQFSDEQEQLRTAVRELLGRHATPRASFDGGPALDAAVSSELAAMGCTGLGLDEADGGSGGDVVDQVVVAEEIGRSVAAVPFVSSTMVSLPLVAALASDEQRARLLPAVAAGEHLLTTCFATPEAGPPPQVEGGRLHGRLALVPDGALSHSLVVPVDDSLFLVSTDASGVAVTDEPSLDRTRRLATVELDGAEAEPLAAGDVVRELTRAWQRALVGLAAEATGSAAVALEATADYAKEREQFGTPIGTFQAVKHGVADMLVAVENARSATAFGAWAVRDDAPDADVAAAAAKATATENAVEVVGRAIQLHGGIAITWEHDLHLHLRRVKTAELLYGEPSRHLDRVAAALLDA